MLYENYISNLINYFQISSLFILKTQNKVVKESIKRIFFNVEWP